MTLSVPIPGRGELRLEHLLVDVNGTLTNRGVLLDFVTSRLEHLRDMLDIRLVSADTFGTLDAIAGRLQVGAVRAATGEDKLRVLDELGRHRCVVIGNGANDALVLEAAPSASPCWAQRARAQPHCGCADVVCASITDALDLLLDPKALSATLRP